MAPEVRRQLAELGRAAQSQPRGLRDREYRALRLGLQALANGQEAAFGGKRLGFSAKHHDLRDCAEIKLPVVQETRKNQDLGRSHRLIYREFEPEDGGPPYRQVISFEHRGDDRPFEVAGQRLGREIGSRHQALDAVSNLRPQFGPRESSEAAPIRRPLPPDIRAALAAASDVAPARGAVNPPGTATSPRAPTGRHSPTRPEPDRQHNDG
ncbi:hypothetical protein [Kribbella monticola]|uniref:hypothetical protein n=1 Tax=Kribbella monticola TaxID=2185285 RepID=UPI0018E54DBD|nr:hypothetical protein [Kribbella monticola]